MCPELELQYNNTRTLIDQVGVYVGALVHPTWNRSQAQGICPSGDFADVTLTPPHPRGASFVGASVCCIWTISNFMNCICSCCNWTISSTMDCICSCCIWNISNTVNCTCSCCIWNISNTMNCICSCCIGQNNTWTNQRLKLRLKLKKSIQCLSCTSWTFTLKVTRFFMKCLQIL